MAKLLNTMFANSMLFIWLMENNLDVKMRILHQKKAFEKATTAVSEELDFSLAIEKCKKGKGCVAALFIT